MHIEADSPVYSRFLENLINRFAGIKATAIVFHDIFYYLLKDLSCYAKIHKELDDAEKIGSFVTYTQFR